MHGTEVVSLDVSRSTRTQFLRTAREQELPVVADLDPARCGVLVSEGLCRLRNVPASDPSELSVRQRWPSPTSSPLAMSPARADWWTGPGVVQQTEPHSGFLAPLPPEPLSGGFFAPCSRERHLGAALVSQKRTFSRLSPVRAWRLMPQFGFRYWSGLGPSSCGGQTPSGLPISHSWPKGSTIRPIRQPCSSPTAAISVAPALTA